MDNIFETATRAKMRFMFKGLISVEELWDLSVDELDCIFKELNKQFKNKKEEGLLHQQTKKDMELETKIEIIKYIFSKKVEEQKERKNMVEKKEKKKEIMAILADKQQESLKGMSIEDLQNMLKEL